MTLKESTQQRILLLDGAMGTMIQTYHLTEKDFRGERFANMAGQMMGNNDILSLTRPDIIQDIHRRYLQAGADIITANTFNSQRVSQADYQCQDLVSELNTQAVRLAREVAEEFSTPSRPRYVIATVGPSNKSLSISPDIADPAARSITYDELYQAYHEQLTALFLAGVDGILFETIFDTLNVKAGLHAFVDVQREQQTELPLMLSVTVNDRQGRLLCGQTLEAFLASVAHAPIFSVGLNCSFGARDMLPALRTLAHVAPYFISAHPNAGLPNAMGQYDQTPEMMVAEMRPFLEEGLVNIVGGCCGTTPQHIALLRKMVDESASAHVPAKVADHLTLSGLEPLNVLQSPENSIFVNVGERCNVAGSRKFLRLIKEKNYEEALTIARQQVEDGAMVLDINMDDGLLDTEAEMSHFLRLIGSDPDICRVPIMIDSSDWQVIRTALRQIQGKSIVNSISLKEGEEKFISHAQEIKQMGAAVVVMAFDEQGQADTYERKIAVCQRAYNLLVNEVQLPATDIIFDPNILSVATGMSEHNAYACDFIRATRWIRQNLPGAHVSGGVSNLSFSFRGNNFVRECMHAAFLYHCRQSGMDFAIVNPSSKVAYDDIPDDLLHAIEEVYLHPSDAASEHLISLATALLEQGNSPASVSNGQASSATIEELSSQSIEEKLISALQRGRTENLPELLDEAMKQYPHVVDIIEGPLMAGMNKVGELFGQGKMFLPQVVKTARTMKAAVNILQPHIQAQQTGTSTKAGRVMVATVKGDVHDIGKNIVSVVMACNGYEIIDLGVMVPAEEIVAKVQEQKPDILGLSGLITPSLEEMIRVVGLLEKAGINIPVMIGGATTSAMHTALKIAPVYSGPVIWVKDASQNAPYAERFLNPDKASQASDELQLAQASLRCTHQQDSNCLSIEEARNRKMDLF